MADIPFNVTGGVKYTAPSFNPFDTTANINGGLSFDLPLATVATFTNQALDFSANNSKNAQGFLSGVMQNSQANVTQVAGQSYDYQNNALKTLQTVQEGWMGVQRYAIKKNYGMGSADFMSGKASCFITTAVTKAQGKPDDCAELQFLRKFRDDYMLKSVEGKALVKLYYAIAPDIVAGLDLLPTSATAYNWLAQNFIYPAIQKISAGHFEEGQGIYTAMVYEAAKLAGVNPADYIGRVKAKAKPLPKPKAPAKPKAAPVKKVAVKATDKAPPKTRAKSAAKPAQEVKEGEEEKAPGEQE